MAERGRAVLRRGIRLALVLILAALTFLMTWVRDPVPEDDDIPLSVSAVPIAIDDATRDALGPFLPVAAWTLKGTSRQFRGLSDVAALPDGRLLFVTDRGRRIAMPPPGRTGPTAMRPIRIRDLPPHGQVDSESLAFDPVTRDSWVGTETINRIGHYSAGGNYRGSVVPPEMAGWRNNTGAEAMALLDDGRFVVIGEGRSKGRDRSFPVVVFPRPPEEGLQGSLSHLVMPGDYRPTGMTQLPDGRVLIVGRAVSPILRFRTIIAIADPAGLKPAQLWRARTLAGISGGPLADNYEGIASETAPGGRLTIWLISDNNEAEWLQSTKLVRLEVDPAAL